MGDCFPEPLYYLNRKRVQDLEGLFKFFDVAFEAFDFGRVGHSRVEVVDVHLNLF